MEMIYHSYSNFYSNSTNYNNYSQSDTKQTFYSASGYNGFENRANRKSVETRSQNSTASGHNSKNNIIKIETNDLDKNNEMIEFKPGMNDVPLWLKSLRLHKYKLLFSELTYEEMLNLTEKELEEKNVTKGARHKIIVNIEKLRTRQSNLINLEKSIGQEGISGVRQCLNELKNMLQTPIKAFDSENSNKKVSNSEIEEGDLPSQFMHLIEKIYNCMQVESMRDDDCLSLYLLICEKCLTHEAFTALHKQRLLKIRSKIEQVKSALHQKKNEQHGNIKWTNPSGFASQNQISSFFKNQNHSTVNTNNFSYGNSFVNSTNSLNSHPQSQVHSHYHHPYQNNKFNSNTNSSLNFNSNNFNKTSNKSIKTGLNVMKVNDNQLQQNDTGMNSSILTENIRKLNENHFGFNEKYNKPFDNFEDRKLNGFSDSMGKFDEVKKITDPISSCSLFSVCTQIGKLTKNNCENINQNSFQVNNDRFTNYDYFEYDSGKKSNETNIFKNVFSENSVSSNNILSYLENSAIDQNFCLNENKYTNCDDLDERLDENHQIYNHIELLSLRMTEQALGSSDFS